MDSYALLAGPSPFRVRLFSPALTLLKTSTARDAAQRSASLLANCSLDGTQIQARQVAEAVPAGT
jgi:hypothetical protein